MRIAAVILTLLSYEAWADDVPRVVKSGVIVTDDGLTLEVHGGAYLPSAVNVARGQDLAKCRAERASLQAAPAPPPPLSVKDTAVLGVIITAVAAAAFAVGRLSK